MLKKNAPTLSELAAAAGVSAMSASRAVNLQPGVSCETREAILKLAAELSITQHVTELDIALNDDIGANRVAEASPAWLARQAQRYADFFKLFIAQRRHITAVLTWVIGDASSWLRHRPTTRFEAPPLFDEKRQPKPAFWALMKLAEKG